MPFPNQQDATLCVLAGSSSPFLAFGPHGLEHDVRAVDYVAALYDLECVPKAAARIPIDDFVPNEWGVVGFGFLFPYYASILVF